MKGGVSGGDMLRARPRLFHAVDMLWMPQRPSLDPLDSSGAFLSVVKDAR